MESGFPTPEAVALYVSNYNLVYLLALIGLKESLMSGLFGKINFLLIPIRNVKKEKDVKKQML